MTPASPGAAFLLPSTCLAPVAMAFSAAESRFTSVTKSARMLLTSNLTSDIFTMRPDGSNLRQLTHAPVGITIALPSFGGR